jgi:pimeloyl-ACP methyl ester carboxylesterase
MRSIPLVLIPGLMCDGSVWSPIFPFLDTDHHYTIADHGSADSLVQMARQILDTVEGPMVLAGHSMGGRVALEVIRLAPERVRGVALMDTGYLPRESGKPGVVEQDKRMALLRIAQGQGVRAMAQEWVMGMVHPDRLADAQFIEHIVAMFERKSADVFACQIHALLNRPDGGDVLQALTIPTLLQCGRQDAWSAPAQHEAMRTLVPAAVLDVIENAGHMAPMEQPEAVAASLNRWLLRCATEGVRA